MEAAQHSVLVENLEGAEGKHRVNCLDWGSPENTKVIICVHGLTRNAHDFDFIAQALCSDYRVLSIDMPGRGDSEYHTDTANYNYGAYLLDCMAVLDNFHIRTADWIGTSMGGIIGMMIAAFHPGRIRRLILNDIGAFIPQSALERIVEYVRTTPEHFSTREEAESKLRQNAASFGITNEDHWRHVFEYSIRRDTDGLFRFAFDPNILEPLRRDTENFMQLQDMDLTELWRAVDIPTLILRGAESDLLEPETVKDMIHTNPKAQCIEFAGVGHAPTLMESDQIQAVVKWLASTKA